MMNKSAVIDNPLNNCGYVLLQVPILADLSYTGKFRIAEKAVDACIVDVVEALNSGGVFTTSSCCMHGEGKGSIVLADGRVLDIKFPIDWAAHNDRT